MHSDISNHTVCQDCRGLCCSQFQIRVVVDTETGLPDWEAQKTRVSGEKEEDWAFIKEHFVPIRQPGDAVYWPAQTESGRWIHELWFTCTAFKNGRCSKYDQRPHLCRIHLCEPAEKRGVNPELDIEKVKNTYKYRFTFPAIEGDPDMNFKKPSHNCDQRFKENAEREKRMTDALPERWKAAAKRAGITQSMEEFAEALFAKETERRTVYLKECKISELIEEAK